MKSINRYIDHAVLKPEMTRDDAAAAIKLGIEHDTRTVCVRPCDIELAITLCQGTATDVSTVLAFPHGATHSRSKIAEAEIFAELEVTEVDMVANYGLIRSKDWSDFETDIKGVFNILSPKGIILKVILETGALELNEISEATKRCSDTGVDFVKTSTGFGPGGASVEAVQAMLDAAFGKTKVKASGGIRTYEEAQRFIDMGCARLGVGFSTTPILCGHSAPQPADHSY